MTYTGVLLESGERTEIKTDNTRLLRKDNILGVSKASIKHKSNSCPYSQFSDGLGAAKLLRDQRIYLLHTYKRLALTAIRH